jgi:hypothetical protein
VTSPREDGGELSTGLLRCPFCHDDVNVAAGDWLACKQCLARHHAPCWTESGGCASCHATETLLQQTLPAPSSSRAAPPWSLVVAVGAIGGAVGFLHLKTDARLQGVEARLGEQASVSARRVGELQTILSKDLAGAATDRGRDLAAAGERTRRVVALESMFARLSQGVRDPAQLRAQRPATLAVANPPPAATEQPGDVVTTLPGTYEDLCVADGGKYLVVKLKDREGLVVFDTDERKIAGTLDVARKDFAFAAGGRVVLVYDRAKNVLESWDVAKLERTKTKPNPFSTPILALVMGHSRDDEALVRRIGKASLLRTATLAPPDGEENDFPSSWSVTKPPFLRADRDLTSVVELAVDNGVTVSVYARNGRAFAFKSFQAPEGAVVPGDDGRFYTSMGSIFSSDLTRLARPDPTSLLPGIGGGFVLGLGRGGRISIHRSPGHFALATCGTCPGWPSDSHSNTPAPIDDFGGLTGDRRITFLPGRNRIVFVPPSNDRIVCRDFDLKASLDKTGFDYVHVASTAPGRATPGTTWEYQVRVLTNATELKYSLARAPEGMSVSDSGKVSWSVPASFSGSEKVILFVRAGSDRQTTYQEFRITSDGGAPPAK